MVNKKNFMSFVVVSILILQVGLAYAAINDLMALQGNVKESGANLENGNLTVSIYDALSGGNLIYNSSTNYNNVITDGKYDVMVGNDTDNPLTLFYGQTYYIDMFVNDESFTFDGIDRQIFQSSIGNITLDHINGSETFLRSDTGWESGGVTVQDGSIWAQTLYVYNLTSLEVSHLSVNGSLIPSLEFNTTFDLGNASSMWRDLYLGRNLFVTEDTTILGNLGIKTSKPSADLHVNGTGIFGKNDTSVELDIGEILASSYILGQNISLTTVSGTGDLIFEDDNAGIVTLSELLTVVSACDSTNAILSGGTVTYSGTGLTFDIDIPSSLFFVLCSIIVPGTIV